MGDDLNVAAGRVSAGEGAGDDLVSEYTTFQSELMDEAGESLGKIVGTQIDMIESDRKFQVGVAFPKNVSGKAKEEAADFKKKAG